MTRRFQAVRLGVFGCVSCAMFVLGVACPGTPISGTVVNVTLREFTVTPARATAPAGLVTFHVTNSGTFNHEFLVIKTDLAPDALPTEDNGSYQEDGPGTILIDEIAEIGPGHSANLTLPLTAGKYVLICNMVVTVDVLTIAHYAQGMRTAFTVE